MARGGTRGVFRPAVGRSSIRSRDVVRRTDLLSIRRIQLAHLAVLRDSVLGHAETLLAVDAAAPSVHLEHGFELTLDTGGTVRDDDLVARLRDETDDDERLESVLNVLAVLPLEDHQFGVHELGLVVHDLEPVAEFVGIDHAAMLCGGQANRVLERLDSGECLRREPFGDNDIRVLLDGGRLRVLSVRLTRAGLRVRHNKPLVTWDNGGVQVREIAEGEPQTALARFPGPAPIVTRRGSTARTTRRKGLAWLTK